MNDVNVPGGRNRREAAVGPNTRGLSAGLTLLEVILALAVLAVLGATFTTAFVNNLRYTSVAGQRTQAAQVLNYFGRRVAGGDRPLLPAMGATLNWTYAGGASPLAAAFPDISAGTGFSDPGRYRVAVTATQNIALHGASVVQYDISVCFMSSGGESCVRGTTLGSPNTASEEGTPPLPGIN